MDFNDYQTKSRKTAGYPDIGHPVIYPTLGLANEAGEVAGKIKKVFRDKSGQISAETREALKAERTAHAAARAHAARGAADTREPHRQLPARLPQRLRG